MTDQQQFDDIIIGTGQAGKPLAFDLAAAGREVAVIERDQVGGSCVNYGCTPTKAMVASGKVAYLADRAEEYGIDTGDVSVRMKKIIERKQNIVDMFREGSEKALEKNDLITLIRGHAQFIDDLQVQVRSDTQEDIKLEGERVFINTGQKPRIPDIDGIDSVPYLTSTSIMEVQEVPDHLLIVGGGYIGLEFGQMFRRFGSDVTIIQRGDQLAPREDQEIAEGLKSILEEDGIQVLLNADATAVSGSEGDLELTVDAMACQGSLEGSHLLLAAGRVPATEHLGLEQTGIDTTERGYIDVNNRLETTAPDVYCLGDVKGGPAFTHISFDDYRVMRENLLNGGDETIDDRMVPYTIFTDPELGRIGINEKLAEKQGISYRSASMAMTRVARAIERSETRGMMKVLVDDETDQILGASILGIEGGELASIIQIAMMGDVPYTELRDGIFSHPTLAESLNNLFARLS